MLEEVRVEVEECLELVTVRKVLKERWTSLERSGRNRRGKNPRRNQILQYVQPLLAESSSSSADSTGLIRQQTMGQSSRELNKTYWQGTAPAVAASSPAPRTGSPAPGSSGSAWRMTKLKRTYEAAEDEGKSIEEVAMERYGSLEAFEEAKEEKRVLDERDSNRRGRRESGMGAGARTPRGMGADGGGRKFVFTEMGGAETPDPSSRPSSRNAFRRPGEAPPTQPSLSRSASTQSLSGSRPSTPVPSVFTPPISRTPLVRSGLSQSTVLNPDPTRTGPAASASGSDKPILSQSELNKLQAKVLKARLMDDESATALEAEYQAEVKRSQDAGPLVSNHEAMAGQSGSAGKATEVQVLPTLDGRGRMYDTGIGTGVADQWEKERLEKGKRGKKEKVCQFSLCDVLLVG